MQPQEPCLSFLRQASELNPIRLARRRWNWHAVAASEASMAYVWFVSLCVVWGSSFILMKKASLALGPVGVAEFRVASGAIMLVIAWWMQSKSRNWPFTAAQLPTLLFVVVAGYAWPFCIQPHLVSLHGSGFIGIMVGLVPIMTILVSIPMLGIYPSRMQVAGVLGGLACVATLLADGKSRNITVWDFLMALSVPLAYAVTNTTIKRRLAKVPPLPLAAAVLVLSSVVLLPFLALPGERPRVGPELSTALLAAGFLGVFGTGAAQLVFTKLILEQGPLFAGMVTYLVPIGAILWGWIDSEPVTTSQIVALTGILLSVAFVQTTASSTALQRDGIEAKTAEGADS